MGGLPMLSMHNFPTKPYSSARICVTSILGQEKFATHQINRGSNGSWAVPPRRESSFYKVDNEGILEPEPEVVKLKMNSGPDQDSVMGKSGRAHGMCSRKWVGFNVVQSWNEWIQRELEGIPGKRWTVP